MLGFILFLFIFATLVVFVVMTNLERKGLEQNILKDLGWNSWNIVDYYDTCVTVKSRQSLNNYDMIKFLKEDRSRLDQVEYILNHKSNVSAQLNTFLTSNNYQNKNQYHKILKRISTILKYCEAYRIKVRYITSANNNLGEKEIAITKYDVNRIKNDPSLIMGKTEYNKLLKQQQQTALKQRQELFYNNINAIITYANDNKDSLVIKGDKALLDNLIGQLFEKTLKSISKIKDVDSHEWETIYDFMLYIKDSVEKIVDKNQAIIDYYNSPDFYRIKNICSNLMSSQKEFNMYIAEKVQSISTLFGTRVVRNETVHNDEYNYIRPYKKTITPFTAEVSSSVFASAENNPLEYIVKYFYPDRNLYPQQIQNLYHLVEELETLREAKDIIENYKKEYQKYISGVPAFIMENDEDGFYSRLGFANISESELVVEYKFSYTSDGGFAQRSFTVPMTEDTIAELIKVLENKLTANAFAKEQRNLMTKKLREHIKKRFNYTCCNCGNSIYNEPNLLLEIDHIIPISKGGRTVESNLQTLCWKCNRSKSSKIYY